MPRTKKRVVKPWTKADLKIIRTSARKVPAAKIAKQLKRTEGAVRQKAGALGVSLRVK